MGIPRQQSGLVIKIWAEMIGNELNSLFREPKWHVLLVRDELN